MSPESRMIRFILELQDRKTVDGILNWISPITVNKIQAKNCKM